MKPIGIAVATLFCLVSTTYAQEAGCQAPVFEVDIFSAVLAPDGTRSVVLSFDDPNPAGVATGYNIYRSPNPERPLSGWLQPASAVVDQDASEPGIQWFESDGELPATGIWYYLATAYSEPCAQEGPWKSLRVSDTRDAPDRMPGDGACLSEDGGCTLRAAIEEANALDGRETVTLGRAVHLLTDGNDLELASPLIIRGRGATGTLIDGQDLARVFRVLPGAEARIEHLTIQRGRSERGGGLLVEATAEATLHAVVVNDNHSTGDGGGVAVDPDARLNLAYSTLSHNVADASGGGLASDGLSTIEHSTLGWNAAGGNDDGSGAGGTEGIGATHGGAIWVGTNGGVLLLHATLSDNRATLGGALASSGAVEMRNSIIANSFEVENCDGPIDSLGNNLSSDSSCDLVGPGDLQDVDPGLGPLHAYGDWETGTYPPLEGSPVIDAAEACPEHDQLFEERTFCSMGATDYHPEYFYVPGGLVYVGDHPRDRDVPGDPVSIVGAPTNQAGGYLTIPDILTIEARSNAKELYLLQAVNHTTPVTQDGLVVYDAVQNSAVGIFSGTDLRDIALKPGGTEIVVTDATTRELRIFSTASRQQTGSIPIPWEPNGVAIHPHGYTAYVTQLSGRVEVVRIDLKTVIGHFDSSPQPVDVAFHPGGHRAYVLNHYGVSVTVVDGAHQVIDTIDLGAPLMNPYDYYGSIAVNPNGDFVYVADGQGGVVKVISTANNQVVDTIAIYGRRVAVHPLGNRVYVGECGGVSAFTVIGVPANNILSSQTLYGSPCGIGILP